MQAVILAAGEGTRLRPLTRNRPKALIPVANRPIIDYPLHALMKCGIREIVVVVGHRKEHVIRYLNGLDLPVETVVQEKQLGTAHALACAQDLIKEDFLLLPGDNYIDPGSIARISAEKNALLIKEHPYPSNFGVVVLRDGHVARIMEKPDKAPTFTVSTGIFSLTKEFFASINGTDMTDAVNEMIAEGGRIKAVMADDWQDAVYPWDLLAMNERLIRQAGARKGGSIGKDVIIHGNVSIGDGSSIGPHSVVHGPVVIGEDTEIGSHCCIAPYTSIGSRVRIEPFTILGNALLMDDSRIGSHSRINDSVIGEGTRLGDHSSVITATPLLEIDEVAIKGRFGCVIGDQVSCSSFGVFEGAIVGNDARINSYRRLAGLEAYEDGVRVV